MSSAVPVPRQVEMFGECAGRLKGVAGEEESRRILEGALVLFSAGGNDMIFNYYDLPRRRNEYNISEYQDFLHGILMDSVKVRI